MTTRCVIGIFLVGFLSACATKSPKPAQINGLEPVLVAEHGRVLRVNPREGYVVLECTYLPIPGEVITLYRDKKVSGSVRVNRQSSGNFIAADIVEGTPMIGDWFRGKPVK